MAKETPAEAAARFRKIAQDPKLPQAVKNTYLDKANAAEKEAAKPTMAKGGAVSKSSVSDKDKKAADKDKYLADAKRANEMDYQSEGLRRKAQNLGKMYMGSDQSKAVYNKQANMAEEDAEVLTERAKQLRKSLDKKPALAKGGAVKKPSVAIMIAVGKPKDKMAKGGAVAKKGCK